MNSGLSTIAPARVAGIVAAARRGVCPTLYVPMQTGDGLLARIRVAGTTLSPDQLSALANLALLHGNGLIEITARGNLQMRGLTAQSRIPFADAVSDLVGVETGLVVDMSPIAGLDRTAMADPRPLARAIREGAAPIEDRLGPKVSIVIDCGGQLRLDSLKADIRIVARANGQWSITLGGGKPQNTDTGGAIATALALLGALAAIGPEARATDLFPAPANTKSARHNANPTLGPIALGDGYTTAIALPHGAARGQDIIALCEQASACGASSMRLAPGHALLIDNAPPSLLAFAKDRNFITALDDPRWRISACIGNEGCRSGHIASRKIAAYLAQDLPQGMHLHVSGCIKGCAHPRPADITLVGRDDGIGLVINGRAGDTPASIFDEGQLSEVFVIHQGHQ